MLWSVYVGVRGCLAFACEDDGQDCAGWGWVGVSLGARCGCVDQGKASVGRWDVIRHQRVSE